MSDELTPIWRNRMRVLFHRQDVLVARVDGLEAQMQWVRSRFAPDTTSPTQSSPPSSSAPTVSRPKSWLQRIVESALDKFGREALTQFALWLAAKLAMWVAPWLLAWWTMGAPLMRFLERWAAVFFG